ncbi:MAG: chaperone modulator CbpM [Gammaproteobacteria bacterium]|nr:chaperone modulator CbpM [Gammaproteobacteria bacterium]
MNSNIIYTSNSICSYYGINKDVLSDMVLWGIASPSGCSPDTWFFNQSDYDKIGRAYRFHRDLEINIPGAAMILELLSELDKVRIEIHQ